MDEPTEEELAATPDPPADLTHEEAVGWRHGWIAAQRAAIAVVEHHFLECEQMTPDCVVPLIEGMEPREVHEGSA